MKSVTVEVGLSKVNELCRQLSNSHTSLYKALCSSKPTHLLRNSPIDNSPVSDSASTAIAWKSAFILTENLCRFIGNLVHVTPGLFCCQVFFIFVARQRLKFYLQQLSLSRIVCLFSSRSLQRLVFNVSLCSTTFPSVLCFKRLILNFDNINIFLSFYRFQLKTFIVLRTAVNLPMNLI